MGRVHHSTDSQSQLAPEQGLLQRKRPGPQRDSQLSRKGGSDPALQPAFIIGPFVHCMIYTPCAHKAGGSENSMPAFPELHRVTEDVGAGVYILSSHSGPTETLM